MDPLTTADNVISLIHWSIKVFRFFAQYYSDVRAAQANFDQFGVYLTQESNIVQEALMLHEKLGTQTGLSPHTLESVAELESLLQEDPEGFYADLHEFRQ